MITICSRWETSQMPPETEWQLWRQLRFFGVDRFVFTPIAPELLNVNIDQYDTLEEALATCHGERVFLELKGEKTMSELPKGDVTFILGNTPQNNLSFAKPDETYRINPKGLCLYGTNAAAIALAYYHGQ